MNKGRIEKVLTLGLAVALTFGGLAFALDRSTYKAASGIVQGGVVMYADTDNYSAVAVSAAHPLPVTGGSGGASALSITPTTITTAGSSKVLLSAAGGIFGFSGIAGSSATHVLLLDAASLPADGAVTPIACIPVTAGEAFSWSAPPGTKLHVSTGAVLVTSSNASCYTLANVSSDFLSGMAEAD